MIRTENSSELSVTMTALFLFSSASKSIRYATLSANLDPQEPYFGQTSLTADYIFSGMTTTARWLYSFKFWTVAYESPRLFEKKYIVMKDISQNPKCYSYVSAFAILLCNIPWILLSL